MDGGAIARVRLLTFTTLYPNEAAPNHGVFVENRLRHLVRDSLVQSTVLAPVPFFPSRHPRFGRWGRYARAPRHERRHGLNIHHPRYPVIPYIGAPLAPMLLYAAARRAARALLDGGLEVDVIDAHYLYPDGVAAILLGRTLNLPVVITVRGSDVTELPDYPLPRRWISWALAHADALIGVSNALSERMVALGADAAKITTLRNGVDTTLFRPPPCRAAARAALQLDGPALLSVGHLIARKGHDRVIAALAELPADHTLLIVGEGPELPALRDQASQLGLGRRVRFMGAVAHERLVPIYAAADTLVLASSREGWANVLLEAMACGTPVVASPIPGNPEVVRSPEAGVIARSNTPGGIAAAIRGLLAHPPGRGHTRAYAERFGWEETSLGQSRVFQALKRSRLVTASRADN